MILRRVIAHFRKQEWTAIAIDFVIVVLGVFVASQVSIWNEARAERKRTEAILSAISADLTDYSRATEKFRKIVADGLAAYDAERARGARPAPFHVRVRGADTPPRSVWEVALQSNIAELVAPDLVFELGFFYSEQQGIGARFVRYQELVEREILPRLGDPDAFYDENGALRPAFAQSMERVREWHRDSAVLVAVSDCLRERFQAPREPGVSCRPDYSDPALWSPQP